MGLLKKALAVVSAPVTAPLKVASNVADNLGIGGPVSALSSLAAAPFELLQKGADFKDVYNQAKPGISILSSAAGGPLGAGLGMDMGAFAKYLPDFSSPVNAFAEDSSYSGGASPTIVAAPKGPNLTPYILGAGALALTTVLIIAIRRR